MQIDGKPRAVEIQAARVFKLPNLITNLIGYTGPPIELFLTSWARDEFAARLEA
jgi:hypothetical protein